MEGNVSASGVMPLKDLAADGDDQDDSLCSQRTLWTRLWHGIAGASIVVNVVAMALEGSAVAIIAGLFAACVAPVVILRQFQLQNTDTLRQVQNALRHEVNRLQIENNKLHSEVNQLESQVFQLQEREERLAIITKEQGTSVDTFVKLVKENRQTTDEMKMCVKADTMQTLVQAILSSDFDSSAQFSAQEVQILNVRLRNIPGIRVNSKALQKAVQSSQRTLEDVLSLVEHMDRDDLPEEERIFQLQPSH